MTNGLSEFQIIIGALSVVYFIFVTTTIAAIIYDKRDPVKTLSWVIVIITIPVIGFLLYIMIGRNYRRRKIFSKKIIIDKFQIGNIISRQLYTVNSMFSDNIPEVEANKDTITLLLNNNKTPLTTGNDVKILLNGDQTFADITEALQKAEKFIHLEYYIINDDNLGNYIADILIERAKAGVEVRVIYDDVGSWSLSKKYIKRLQNGGVAIFPFLPVIFPILSSRLNYRNHRKIIVIDGRIAFTGGINIADRYIFGSKKLGAWRDTHIRIVGDAALSLQVIFATDWYFASEEKLTNTKYFPKKATAKHEKGDLTVQIASSGPDSDWASIMQAYFAAITRAKSHIYISTPYFMPNNPILTAIKVASLSGVDVKILLPNRSDNKIVFWATRSYISELIEAGVKVYLYGGGFIHAKVLMIDGVFSSVGSANMDERSFEDNFEVSAFIYDKEKTMELEKCFKDDLALSRRVKNSKWVKRSKIHSFYEALARLLSPLL